MNTPDHTQIPRKTLFMHVEETKKINRMKEKKKTTSTVVRPLFPIVTIPIIIRHTEELQFQMELDF
jgi:hypothetical protein